jgi:diguanylate cyclase
MNDEESKEKNYEYVRLALPLMSEHDIPITPRNYAVWYKYVSGSSHELSETIDRMIKNKEDFSEEKNEKLYWKFCAEKDESELRRLREGLQQILGIILMVVKELTGQTEQYESAVSKSVSRLSEEVSGENIRDIVDEIIEETKAIGNHGRTIQNKLKETTEDLQEIQKDFEEAKSAALVDFLTGTPNRKALDEKFAEYAGEAVPGDKDLCLLMIDIDHFKKFNDKYGHIIGDEVLKFVAKRVKEIVRGRDFFARFGGEEFAVLLPQTPLPGAKVAAENIRKFFAEATMKTVAESLKLGTITVSIGVACYRRDESFEELIKRSDQALYYAKNAGRNRVATELDMTTDSGSESSE